MKITSIVSHRFHVVDDVYPGCTERRLNCVAQVPSEGLLDREKLAQFATELSEFTFVEKAQFREGFDIALTVEAGGCAHYAVSLTYVFEDDESVENKIHYVEKVKSLLEKTPFNQDGRSWKSDFFRAFDKNCLGIWHLPNSTRLQHGLSND